MRKKKSQVLASVISAITLVGAGSAMVQAASEQDARRSAASVLMEEIVITATKKAGAEQLQDVPIAVTAYNEEQLEMLHVRDLQGLSYTMPNVSMDDVGTIKGVANFSFRGLGVASSIPSVDPTVGVFVDGVYMGTNYGVVFDQFDLGGIEVLRGPQGLLFGRNVTGGAVVINTKKPTEEFEGYFRAAVETGLNKYVMGSVSGPLIENKLLGKLAVYRNDDDGYFKNDFNDNDNFGASETTLIRGAITYFPTDDSELTVKYENGDSEGDGAASQNNAWFERGDSHDVNINEEGFNETGWDFVSATYTTDLGAGVLTNIIGWRDLDVASLFDVDGSPVDGFTSGFAMNSEQFSEELRFNITLGDKFDLTTGLYYFTQEVNYVEHRLIPAIGADVIGGGTQDQSTVGIFATGDWRVTDSVTINTGFRYTQEEKEVKVATISSSSSCDLNSVSCSNPDFEDDESWSNITPKLGIQWFVDQNTQVYASYSKGFRSGGYNLRNTVAGVDPGPFDEEEQDSFEVGVKWDAFDGKLRINAAAFQNEISDMQREAGVPGALGIAQVIANTADVTITGFELEVMAALTDNLILGANLGLLDGDYDKVRYDISGDGVVDGVDTSLALPRLAPMTSGVNLTWQDTIFSGHTLLARVSYSHRDESASSDDNTGILPASDIIDANVSFTTADGAVTVSVFGRNLTDEVTLGLDASLPSAPFFGYLGDRRASFSPINKGRVLGAEVSYNF